MGRSHFFIAIIAIFNHVSESKKGLGAGNMQSVGNNRFKMVLANSNDKADYAVIRLRQHGNDTCLYKTYLAVNSSVEVTFRCPGLTLGEFEWTTYWSAAKPELARLARVID